MKSVIPWYIWNRRQMCVLLCCRIRVWKHRILKLPIMPKALHQPAMNVLKQLVQVKKSWVMSRLKAVSDEAAARAMEGSGEELPREVAAEHEQKVGQPAIRHLGEFAKHEGEQCGLDQGLEQGPSDPE